MSKQTTTTKGRQSAVVERVGRGTERYVVRTSTGQVLQVKTTASSTASMDKTVKRFAEAIKRLAKR